VIFSYETEFISIFLDQEHRESHFGINKMVDIISKKYYGIKTSFIVDFVNKCRNCRNFVNLSTQDNVNLVQIKYKYDRYVIDCVDLRRYQEENDG
ncbi:hypothetical protein H312_03215, partial [Anncaliia algerae PRA339]